MRCLLCKTSCSGVPASSYMNWRLQHIDQRSQYYNIIWTIPNMASINHMRVDSNPSFLTDREKIAETKTNTSYKPNRCRQNEQTPGSKPQWFLGGICNVKMVRKSYWRHKHNPKVKQKTRSLTIHQQHTIELRRWAYCGTNRQRNKSVTYSHHKEGPKFVLVWT